MSLRTLSRREFRRHPGRTVLTVLGIAVGVATIFAITVTIDVMNQTYRDLFKVAAGKTPFEITAVGEAGFDPAIVDRIAAVDGVSGAVALIQTPTAVLGKAGPVPVLSLGVNPGSDRTVRDYDLSEGRFLERAGDVLLTETIAEANGLARTALTAGVLFIAIILTVAMAISITSSMSDIRDYYEHIADNRFFVRGAWPGATMLFPAAIPEALHADLEALDGVKHVGRLNWFPARAGGVDSMALVLSLSAAHPAKLDLEEGSAEEIREGLLRGEVVLGTALARKLGAGRGDRVTLQTPAGDHEVMVAGKVQEFAGGGLAFYMEWKRAQELYGFTGVHCYFVEPEPGAAAALDARLTEFCNRRHLSLQPIGELQRMMEDMAQSVLAFFWLVLALIFLVASLGVINTLTMNVREQTREIGLLRAVALTQRQVRKLILSQAVLISAMSLVPGFLVGLALAKTMIMTHAIVNSVRVEMLLDPVLLSGCVLVGLLIALTAAWFPARRAARMRLMAALRFD